MTEITQTPLSEAYEKFGAPRTIVMAKAEQFLTRAVMAKMPAIRSRIDTTIRLFAKQPEKLKPVSSRPELYLKDLGKAQFLSRNLARAIGESVNNSKQRGEIEANTLVKNIYTMTPSDLETLQLSSDELKMQAFAAVIVANISHEIHSTQPAVKTGHYKASDLGQRIVQTGHADHRYS